MVRAFSEIKFFFHTPSVAPQHDLDQFRFAFRDPVGPPPPGQIRDLIEIKDRASATDLLSVRSRKRVQ
jgi:hypothetical protein